ncbi:MAG: hypothetical protein NZ951_04200 [Dehalococcoidia bacterium]|nr:hypothetical protein [Dehalococcoidia bacterium]MDW8119638.1 hypothetical protein [Chloroflexota bacterium]
MRGVVLWLVIGGVMAVVGYSALVATRAQRPEVPAPQPVAGAPSPCQVTSYDLSPTGAAVQAVVVCSAGGRYQVAAEAAAGSIQAKGHVVVRVLKDAPTAVSIPLMPSLPPTALTYSVRFTVRGM